MFTFIRKIMKKIYVQRGDQQCVTLEKLNMNVKMVQKYIGELIKKKTNHLLYLCPT